MKAQTVDIYVLKCPYNGQPKYVGKANNAELRLKSHLRDSRRRNTPLYRWIRDLQDQGKIPIIEVIAQIPPDSWKHAERQYISEYRRRYNDLLNVAQGGDEPFCTTSQRAMNGRANALLIHSNPRRKQIWAIKTMMGQSLTRIKKEQNYSLYNRIVKKLHTAARKNPVLFGEYLHLKTIQHGTSSGKPVLETTD